MATFRKRRGPGAQWVWQAQIIRTGRKSRYRTFDTRGAAQAWARTIERAMDSDEADRSEGERTSLGAALERYAREVLIHKAASSQVNEGGRLCRLKRRRLARLALARITGADISEYIRGRAHDGVGANTVRLELALISHCYTVARTAWGMSYLINPVPLASSARMRLPAGRDRRLRDAEEGRLLDSATPIFALVIRWALATAMRRGEIAGLTWECINREQRSAYLGVTKNATPRTVPLSAHAVAVLDALGRRRDGPVFGMSSDAISVAWARTRARAGIEGLRFHDLRHEAISRLFERTDLDAMEIARISGHRTLSMLSRYTHLRARHLAYRLDGVPRGQRE